MTLADDLRAAAARLNELATEGSDHDKAHLLNAHADTIERVTKEMREVGKLSGRHGMASTARLNEWANALNGEPS